MHDDPHGDRARLQAALRAIEARHRALAAASADVIYRMSPDWSEMRQLDGGGFLSDTAEPSGSWLERYIHPDDRERVTEVIGAAVRAKSVFELEHRVVRADGTLGWTFSRAVPLLDADGEIIEWIGAASDVTARHEADAALRASEARYRTLFDSIDEGFCVVEVLFDDGEQPRDYRFVETNPAFVRQTGLVDAVGRTMRELAPAHEPHWFEIYGRVARTGVPTRFEAPAAALGRWYDVYAFRIGEPAERRVAILFTDIAGRKRAEEALRESEARQAFLLQLSDALRPLGDPQAVKATATRLLGEQLRVNRVFYADAEDGRWLVTQGYETGVDPLPDQPFVMSQYGDWIIRGFKAGNRLVVHDMHADGRFGEAERQAHLSLQIGAEVALPLVKGGELRAMLVAHGAGPREWSAREVAILEEAAERTWAAVERARAEVALRMSEAKYRTLFETMGQGYCDLELVRDADGRVVDQQYIALNPAFERLFGIPVERALGRRRSELFPGLESRWQEAFDRVARSGVPERIEHEESALGRWYEMWVYPRGRDRLAILYEDTTERKRAEAVLRESEARQAFLLELSDAVRACPDEQSIMQGTVTMLGEHLRLDRCYVSEVFEEEDYSTVGPEHVRAGFPSMIGRYRLSDYPETQRQMATQPLVIDDAGADPRFSDEQKAMLALVPQRALLVAPLRKGPRRIIWALAGAMATPRRWTSARCSRRLPSARGPRWSAPVPRRRCARARRAPRPSWPRFPARRRSSWTTRCATGWRRARRCATPALSPGSSWGGPSRR